MGIRIHKGLGFTLPDFVKNDPRINWDWFTNFREKSPSDVMLDFSKWTGEKDDSAPKAQGLSLGYVPHSWVINMEVYDLIVTDDDEDDDLENPFFVIKSPVISHHHNDDAIDYAEAMLKDSEPCLNSLISLPIGFFPWSNSFMFAETGERANVCSFNGELEIRDQKLWETFGHLTQEELKKIFVPNVPSQVRNMCEYFGFFKDSKAIIWLRPCIYVYWS